MNFQEQIKNFERWNLDTTGHYKGLDLTKFGFPYRPGNYIPIDERYSAYCQLSHAIDVIFSSVDIDNECPICKAKMFPVGVGVYPYNCDSKRKLPNAIIFDGCKNGHNGWHHSTRTIDK